MGFGSDSTGQLTGRNELWDHESNHSLNSYLPGGGVKSDHPFQDSQGYYGSRAPSSYGGDYMQPDPYQPDRRTISQAGSYRDLRAGSRPVSYAFPGAPVAGSVTDSLGRRGGPGQWDQRSFYAGSIYNAPSAPPPQMPPMEQRHSSYSFYQQDPRASSYSLAGPTMGPSPSVGAEYGGGVQTGSTAQLLPDLHTEELSMGQAGVTDTQLELSIRKICQNADLDKLTKKGVRKQLEGEYGCDFGPRKDVIGRLIEKVLCEFDGWCNEHSSFQPNEPNDNRRPHPCPHPHRPA